MKIECKKCVAFVAFLCFVVDVPLMSQTYLFRALEITNTTNSTSQRLEASSSTEQSQGFNFPGVIGTVGQVITVQSVDTNIATFQWSTPTGGYTNLSSVTTADVSDASTWAQGPTIALSANTNYRIYGQFEVYRSSTTGLDDAFQVALRSVPSGTTADYTFICLDCPAGTTGVPLRANAVSGGNIVSGTIDPGGATNLSGPTNKFHYRLEGILNVSTTTGTVTFGFNKSGGNNANNTVLLGGSFWTIIPLAN